MGMRSVIAAAALDAAVVLVTAQSPPPVAAGPPPPHWPEGRVFEKKMSVSLITMIVLLTLCMCCGCTFVISHWCGLGKKVKGMTGYGRDTSVYTAYSEYFYGPGNDGRGKAGLGSYRTKQEAAEALEVLAERLRRSAVSLMVFSFWRIWSLNGLFGLIASCAVTCCASPPGLKGVIKSASCARTCAIICAVLSALMLCLAIPLAIFGVNARDGVDEACDAATKASNGEIIGSVTITKGPLNDVTIDDGEDFCSTWKTFFDYAAAIVFSCLVIPDLGCIISSICVAHFAGVLMILSKTVGPMEVSPLMYR